jgi:hypothetical protein
LLHYDYTFEAPINWWIHNPDLVYHLTTDPVVMYLAQQFLQPIVFLFLNQWKQQQKVIATHPEQMIAPMSWKQYHQFQRWKLTIYK